jgi:hypothetical protein
LLGEEGAERATHFLEPMLLGKHGRIREPSGIGIDLPESIEQQKTDEARSLPGDHALRIAGPPANDSNCASRILS